MKTAFFSKVRNFDFQNFDMVKILEKYFNLFQKMIYLLKEVRPKYVVFNTS